MIAVALVVGYVLRQFLSAPFFQATSEGIIPHDYWLRVIIFEVYIFIAAVIPNLVALVMLWVAFIKVEVRDRYLWSALMILSSVIVVQLLDSFVWLPRYRFLRDPIGLDYFDSALITGAVAYAAVYFALAKRKRPTLTTIPLIGLAALFVLPLLLGDVSWVTALCSLFGAMGIWSIGVRIAERAGFDVYGIDESNAS